MTFKENLQQPFITVSSRLHHLYCVANYREIGIANNVVQYTQLTLWTAGT